MPSRAAIKASSSIDVGSLRELDKSFDALERKILRGALRSALPQAARPAVKMAREKAPVNSEILKKSLGTRVVTSRDGAVSVWISARRKMSEVVRVGTRDDGTPIMRRQTPARYIHLVELGTSKLLARPFLRPALDASRDAVVDKFRELAGGEIVRKVAERYRRAAARGNLRQGR